MGMASIYRSPGDPRNPNWLCFFRDGLNERRCRSTGTQDRKLATKICLAFDDAADKAGRGELTPDVARAIVEKTMKQICDPAQDRPLPPRRTRKVRRLIEGTINAIARDVGTQLPPKQTVDEFLRGWRTQAESRLSIGTYARYAGIIDSFLDFLGSGRKKSLGAMQPADILRYRDDLAGRVSSGTVNTHLKVLRVAFGRAVKMDLIDRNPAQLVDTMARDDRHRRRAFTIPELRKVLELARDDWRTMILVGLYTGLRLADIANLTWTNVDLQREEITVTTAKTDRTVILPIAKPLLRHVSSLAGDDPKAALCPDLQGKSSSWLSNQFYDLMAGAGLVSERDHQAKKGGRSQRRTLNPLSFHALRHTATSLLKNAGVSDVVARDIIGHDSEAISRNYTHIETETKRKAVNSMPDILT